MNLFVLAVQARRGQAWKAAIQHVLPGLDWGMRQSSDPFAYRLPVILLCGLFTAAIAGWAFLGWVRYGSAILLSSGETALSWCF